MSEKIQKVLARAGVASRRAIEKLLVEGKIQVNGVVATLGDRITLEDNVKVSGRPVEIKSAAISDTRVIAYFKPVGQVCTRKDTEGRKTVFEKLPALQDTRWINVGRLDINSSGLLLFTTDGELAHRLMHPSYQIKRTYEVKINKRPSTDAIAQLKAGVELEDGIAHCDALQKINRGVGEHWFSITLHEGKYREVRRMWNAVGYEVKVLKRIQYGPVKLLSSLSKGDVRWLSLSEVRQLRKMVGLAN